MRVLSKIVSCFYTVKQGTLVCMGPCQETGRGWLTWSQMLGYTFSRAIMFWIVYWQGLVPLEKDGCSWGQLPRKETRERTRMSLAFNLLALRSWDIQVRRTQLQGLRWYLPLGDRKASLRTSWKLWTPFPEKRTGTQTFYHNYRASMDLAESHPWISQRPPRIWYGSNLGPKRSASSAQQPKNKLKQNETKKPTPYSQII